MVISTWLIIILIVAILVLTVIIKFVKKVIHIVFVSVIGILIIVGVFYFLSPNLESIPIEVTDFDSCVLAGNPVMESYPRQCRYEDTIYVEDISEDLFECSQDERDILECPDLDQPVCATVNIVCVTEPCDPIQETYQNQCLACQNELVESYSWGECEE